MSVYFVQAGDTGLIKIGHAKSVTKRLGTLQTGSESNLKVLYEMRGGHVEEQGLHAAFAKHRVRGEWFRPHSDIFNWIAKFKGEKRETQKLQDAGFDPVKARRFLNKFSTFLSKVINDETEDGKAARMLFRHFMEQDEEYAPIMAAHKGDGQ